MKPSSIRDLRIGTAVTEQDLGSYALSIGIEYEMTPPPNEGTMMIRLTGTAETKLDRDAAFDHVGDFGNVESWDPGVISSTKVTEGDVGVGTTYDVVISYRGRQMKIPYEITEYVPGHKIILEGRGARVHAVDVIDFVDENGGTLITYTADLSLTGLGRFVEPLLGGRLRQIGADAVAGMREWMRELEKAAGLVV